MLSTAPAADCASPAGSGDCVDDAHSTADWQNGGWRIQAPAVFPTEHSVSELSGVAIFQNRRHRDL
jgi:hypothetical protein